MVQEVPDGGRKPRVTDQEILDVLRGHRDPVLSTAEVADELTIKRRGTLNRLRELEEEGAVVSKQIGGRNTVWWLTPETDRASPLADPGPENDIAASDLSEPADDAGERSEPADGDSMAGVEEGSPGAHPGGDAPRTGLQNTEPGGTDLQDAETDGIHPALADVDFPVGRDRQECIEALVAARDHLQEHGPSSMRELVADVMPDHPVGYDVPEVEDGDLVADRFRGAWWRKVVRPGLEACDDIEVGAGVGKWRLVEEEQ